MRNLLLDAENATLNFDEWHKGLEPEYRDAIGFQLGIAQDPNAEKRRIASTLWLSAQTGYRVSDVESNYEDIKAKWAAQKELPADQWKDEVTFQSAVRTDADDFRSQRILAEDLAKNARRAALWSPQLPVEAMPDMSVWHRAKAGDRGYRPEKKGIYEVSFAEQMHQFRDRVAPVLPLVNTIWGVLANKEQSAQPGDLYKLSETIANLAPDLQDTVMTALYERAEMLPPEEKEIYLKRWGEAVNRGLDLLMRETIYRAPDRTQGGIAENIEMGLNALGIAPETAQDVGDWGRQKKRVQQVMGRLAKLREGKILPNEGENLLERVGLGVAGSAPGMAAAIAMTPLALYPMLEGQAYDDLEENFRAAGLDDKQAGDLAQSISPFAGAAMTAVEYLTFGFNKGPTAALQRKIAQKIATSRPVTAWAAGMALETAEQFGQEVLQDTLPVITADLAGMLGVKVPDQNVLAKLSEAASPETLGVSIVFALGGGTKMPRVQQARALQSIGFTPEAVEAVLAAPTDTARQEAFAKGLETATPPAEPVDLGTPSQAEEADANDLAGLRQITRDSDGWWLEHKDGSRTKTSSAEAAIALRDEIGMTRHEETASHFVRLMDWMSGDKRVEQSIDSGFVQVDDAGAFIVRPGGERLSLEMDKEGAAELQSELQRLRAISNDPNLTGAMLGQNVVSWKQRVSEDAAALAERIQTKTFVGANITTPIHERIEARLTELVQTGKMQWSQVTEAIRTLEQATGTQYLGKDANETDIRETAIELVVADTVGRRRDGTRHKAGSLAKQIKDATRANPEQRHVLGKLGDLLRAVRAHVQAITKTAAAIIRARRAGKLGDTDAFTSFADTLLDLDSQNQFEDQVVTTVEDLARSGVTSPINVDLAGFRKRNRERRGFSLGISATDGMSKVDARHDDKRVGTAKLGTKVRQSATPQTSNIHSDIVPVTLLARQMAKVDYKHLPEEVRAEQNPEAKRRLFMDWIKENLLALHDAFPEGVRARATHWYDGANKIANQFAAAYNKTVEQASGVIAVLSPQKDWFMNVAQARQVMEIWENDQSTVLTQELIQREFDQIVNGATADPEKIKKARPGETALAKKRRLNKNKKARQEAKDERRADLSPIIGKTIAELDNDPYLQAWAIRILAQTKYGRQFDVISPEGDFMGPVVKKDGQPRKNGWGSTNEIMKAVRIMRDGSLENISENLGNEHKVRNFYNNIVAPNSPFGDATIDTHAVAAAHLMPFGSSAREVAHNFGSGIPTSDPLGVSGIYHIYLDAYTEAAEERGIQPRQLQSITWEAIRKLFPSESRRDKKVVEFAIKAWQSGSREDARNTIIGRGIPAPVWDGTDDAGESEGGAEAPESEGSELVPDADLQVDGQRTGFSLIPVLDRIEGAGGRLLATARVGEDQGGSGADVRGRVGRITPEDFSRIAGANKRSHKFGTSVDVYDPASYEGYDLLVVERDGETATASISPSGEIGAVTKSLGGKADMVAQVFDAAVSTGRVKWLNGFDTVLPGIYSELGFKAEARLPFNDEYAPDGWDFDVYKKFNAGRPDVVFMRYVGEPQTYQDGDGKYVEDYDAGVDSVTSFSLQVTAKQDAAYAAAEKAGDEKTGAAMLGEVIKASGLPILDDSASEAYRVRRTAPPKKTVKAYKLFATNPKSPGKLFPLFVGANEAIPQGVWLDAIAGKDAPLSKTGKRKVQSKLGPLAYRPGWHAGDIPYASHIGVKDSDGKVYARRGNEVWAEVEMAADVDYQDQANASPTKDIREMPVDGSYRFKTNPNMTGQWVISGAMKVNRVMSQQEVDAVLKKSGVKPMPWVGGPLVLEKLGLTNETAVNRAKLADTFTYDEAGKLIPLSKRMNPNDERVGFSLTSNLDAVADALTNRRLDPKERLRNFEAARQELVGMKAAMAHNDSLGTQGPWLEMAHGREMAELRRKHDAEVQDFLTKSVSKAEADLLEKHYEERIAFDAENVTEADFKAQLKKLQLDHEFDMEAAKEEGWTADQRDALKQRQRLEIAQLEARADSTKLSGDIAIAKAKGRLLARQAKELATLRGNKKVDHLKGRLDLKRRHLKEIMELQAKQRAEADKRKAKLTADEQAKETTRALAVLDAILMQFPAEVRGKVGGWTQIAGKTTDLAREKFLRQRIEKLDAVFERYLQREYTDQMFRLIRRGTAKGAAGEKMKGFDADTHRLFKAIKAAMKMDHTAVQGRLADLDQQINSGQLTPEQEAMALTEQTMVNLAGEWSAADAARMAAAVKAADDIYTSGRLDFQMRLAAITARRTAMAQGLMQATGKLGAPDERIAVQMSDDKQLGIIKKIFLDLSSFAEVMEFAFGDVQEVVDIIDRERAAAYQLEDRMQALANDIEDLFTSLAGSRLDGEKLRYRMSQKSIMTGGRWGMHSELEIIQALLMWRQPDGRRHMEAYQIDQAWVDGVTKSLEKNPEGRKVMDFLAARYAEEYAVLNPIYREAMGVDLPFNALYSPLTVTPQQVNAGQITDPATGAAVNGGGTTPPALRTRSATATAEPKFQDALQTLLTHRRQIEHWMAYQELGRDMSAVLGNRNLLNSVEAKGGKQVRDLLLKWTELFNQGGVKDASSTGALVNIMRKFLGRFARMALVGRVGVLAIQSTQLAAAAATMPPGAYAARFSKLMAGQLGWGDALRSPFVQRRIKQLPPVVQQAFEGLQSDNPNAIKHAAQRVGQWISGADGLFTAGTYAIVFDYQKSLLQGSGLSEAEINARAHKNAERITEKVAQPTRMGTRSYAEITATHPLAKLGWAFASEARQKLALAYWAGMNAGKDPGHAARVAFVVWGIGGLGAAIIRNAWRDLRDDDDDEVFDDKNWGKKRLIAQTLAGPLNGVPMWGDAVEGIINATAGQPIFAIDPTGSAQGAYALRRLLTGKSWDDDENIEAVIRDAEKVMTAIGSYNETAASATSLFHLLRDSREVLDNLIKQEKEPSAAP